MFKPPGSSAVSLKPAWAPEAKKKWLPKKKNASKEKNASQPQEPGSKVLDSENPGFRALDSGGSFFLQRQFLEGSLLKNRLSSGDSYAEWPSAVPNFMRSKYYPEP